MFILIWVTLFFSVRGNKDGTASFPGGKQHCTQNDYCVTLTEGEISAETGLCVVLQCSFTTAADFNVQSVICIIINDLKTSDSGSYKLRDGGTKRKKDGFTFESKATVTVTGLSQKPTVMVPPLTEGQQTTLTCTAPGLCSGSDPKITWTWRGAGEKDPHITGNITANQGRTSNLTFNPSAEHHGTEVTCKVSFRGNMTTEETVTLNVSYVKELKINGNTAVKMDAEKPVTAGTVSFFTKISACELQSDVLTCVCISEGFPLPTIKWPLLQNYTEYSVITTVVNQTVNSTMILTAKHHSNTVVECVSSNGKNETKNNLTINLKQEDLLTNLLTTVQQPQVITAFLTGILLSAPIFCLAGKCHGKKQRRSGSLSENLEMVTAEAVPLVDDGQAVEDDDRTHNQEAAEGGAEAAGQSAPDGEVEPKEVEYSNIDFSVLKRKSPEETQEPTETEYAEIKKEATEESQDDGSEEGEVLEGNKEEEVMMGEDWETEQCTPAEEEGGEDVALYSNVNEIMSQAE
ncbi:sialic acid-binding Ig-like lectin 5 [Lates japonicus]|uniref:Sialic acid-binding Ig-like lectin 5 n=1 Tax=Lates japonicus TaxID=270547 RepID=A0AAD3R0V1_LATJO|nr:sialic acid-binding Ig-like lectin 5 [Lates japonicus]